MSLSLFVEATPGASLSVAAAAWVTSLNYASADVVALWTAVIDSASTAKLFVLFASADATDEMQSTVD